MQSLSVTSSEPSDSENDDSNSSDAGSNTGNVLIDLEAVESGNESDSSEGSVSSAGSDTPYATFHTFRRLPAELRRRVWEIFCPDLLSKSCVLQFNTESDRSMRHSLKLTDGFTLEGQTLPMRRLLAVHRESRGIALQRFPDTLPMHAGSGDALVNFHKERDVVMICSRLAPGNDMTFMQAEFTERIVQLALPLQPGGDSSGLPPLDYSHFPRLKRVFVCDEYRRRKRRDLHWCVSEYTHQHLHSLSEREPGLGEDLEYMYCWPNVDDHVDFAKHQVPPLLETTVPPDERDRAEELGIEIWPMALFQFESGMARYEALMERRHIPIQDEDSDGDSSTMGEGSDSDPGTDLDAYESDGIDDAEIVDDASSSEDELIPNAISSGSLLGASDGIVIHDSSSDPDDRSGSQSDGSTQNAAGNFSSPEPDGNEASAPSGRGRKRRIVTDSDDESTDSEPKAKRVRTVRAVLDSDDDEVQEITGNALANGGVVVVSGSDAGSDDDDVESRGPKRRARVESSSSEDDEESEDGGTGRKMTLAERLQLPSRAVPDSVDSDGISDDSDVGSSQQDDDDEEEDESEDETNTGFFDNMAEEEDSDDE